MYTLAHTCEHCLYFIVLVVRRIEGITIWKSVFVPSLSLVAGGDRWRPDDDGQRGSVVDLLFSQQQAAFVLSIFFSSFCYPPLGLESLTFIHCVSRAELQPFPTPCLSFLIIKSLKGYSFHHWWPAHRCCTPEEGGNLVIVLLLGGGCIARLLCSSSLPPSPSSPLRPAEDEK